MSSKLPGYTKLHPLRFRALGCLVPSCKLCKHNPSRRCAVNFDKKYLVNDILKAKCQAVIRVEIVERATNQPVEDASFRDDIILQMAILDGNTYDAKFEAGMEGDFESCLLLMNNKVCLCSLCMDSASCAVNVVKCNLMIHSVLSIHPVQTAAS